MMEKTSIEWKIGNHPLKNLMLNDEVEEDDDDDETNKHSDV